MITEELLVFIRKERKKKIKDIDIRGMLVAHGWTKEQIDEGFNRVDGNIVEQNGSPLGTLPPLREFLEETRVLCMKNILFFIKLFLHIFLYAVLLLILSGALAAFGVWVLSLDAGLVSAGVGGLVLTTTVALFVFGAVYLSVFATGGFVMRLLGQVETVKEARHKVRPYVWKLFLTNALLSLVLLFGYLLLIIPGVILAVRLLFTKYIVFTEDETGRAAIAKSFFYTKGFFWKITERLAPIFGITWLLNIAFRFFLESENWWFLALPFWVLTVLAGIFLSVGLFVLYQHVRTAKGDIVPDEETFAKHKKRVFWAATGGLSIPLVLIGISVLFFVKMPDALRSNITSRVESLFLKETTQQLPFDPKPELFDTGVLDEKADSSTGDDISSVE